MNRFRASGLHFAISILIATSIFLCVYFLWYPDALFERAGGKDLFYLIAGVDVTLGPLITLIIFKPGKRGLKFDLLAIATVQLAALVYGVDVLYESRPVYIVFVKDRFELARANDIDRSELARARPPYDRLPILGPRFVGARLPKDPDEQLRIMMSASTGVDLQAFPQHYVPYDDVRMDAVDHAAPFSSLRKYNDGAPVDELLQRLGGRQDSLGVLPVRAGKTDLTAVINDHGDVLYIASLQPWQFK
jgi:hypothetical protein